MHVVLLAVVWTVGAVLAAGFVLGLLVPVLGRFDFFQRCLDEEGPPVLSQLLTFGAGLGALAGIFAAGLCFAAGLGLFWTTVALIAIVPFTDATAVDALAVTDWGYLAFVGALPPPAALPAFVAVVAVGITWLVMLVRD